MDLKKVVIVLLVVFLGFWLVTDPSGLAEVTSVAGTEGGNFLKEFFSSVIDFIGEVA